MADTLPAHRSVFCLAEHLQVPVSADALSASPSTQVLKERYLAVMVDLQITRQQ